MKFSIFKTIIVTAQIFHERLESYSEGAEQVVTVKQLTRFLVTEQGEKVEEKEVSRHMREYLQDAQRNVQEPYFTTIEVSLLNTSLAFSFN